MKKFIAFSENGLLFLFLLSWSVYVFYPFSLSEPGISADGVTYIHIAKNIISDGSPGWQATWAAPFFSVMMAAQYLLIGNFAVAGMLVSKIMTILLPLAVYLLAKDVFNSKVGIFAAVLTAFHPHFTFISGSLEPEMTYTTLLAFSFWALWRAFQARSSKFRVWSDSAFRIPHSTFGWAILAGIISSLAYQTRSEGMLIFIFAVTSLTMINFFNSGVSGQEPGERLNSHVSCLTILLLITAFILTSLPYLIFLKGTYGKWVLSPKSTYVQIWMKSRIYRDNDLGEQGNPELWGLSKNGKLMWQEPKGIGDLIAYLMSQPEKSLKVYLHNFSYQIPGWIPNNSGQWLYPQVYPWYFVMPALFWISVSFRRKEDWSKTIFLLSPFAILLILPIFTEGWWKYLLPYSPFLIILAVAGLSLLCERIQWKYLLPILAVVVALYSLWTVKASPFAKSQSLLRGRISMSEEQKKAGEWAQNRFKGTPNYMVQWSKLAYYLDGRWTAMPVTDVKGMVWYARKNNVDYIVFETGGRVESEEIIQGMGNVSDLEVADFYENISGNYGVVFLKLKK